MSPAERLKLTTLDCTSGNGAVSITRMMEFMQRSQEVMPLFMKLGLLSREFLEPADPGIKRQRAVFRSNLLMGEFLTELSFGSAHLRIDCLGDERLVNRAMGRIRARTPLVRSKEKTFQGEWLRIGSSTVVFPAGLNLNTYLSVEDAVKALGLKYPIPSTP